MAHPRSHRHFAQGATTALQGSQHRSTWRGCWVLVRAWRVGCLLRGRLFEHCKLRQRPIMTCHNRLVVNDTLLDGIEELLVALRVGTPLARADVDVLDRHLDLAQLACPVLRLRLMTEESLRERAQG